MCLLPFTRQSYENFREEKKMLPQLAVILLLVSSFHKQVFCGVEVPPDTVVDCSTDLTTSSSGVCSGNSIGSMTALACCEGVGNTLSFNNQCLGCLLIGFNESVLDFTSDNAGLISQVNIVIKKRINPNALAQFDVTSREFSISDQSEINGFAAAYPIDQEYLVTRDSSIEQPFLFKISSNGNSKALEDPLTFVIEMSLDFILPFVDFALVIFQERVTITIADLDVLRFSLEGERGTVFTEGDEGGVIVERELSIRPSRPVTVFVETRLYSGDIPLGDKEYIADVTDFMPGEIETYVFEEDGEFRIQKLFSAKEDSIVEPGREVIEVVLSTNESLVEIVPDKRTQLLFIVDDDVFRIGFDRTELVVHEGEVINLILKQTNNVIGQQRSNDSLGAPNINNIPITATVGRDYSYTDTAVPTMRINAITNQLDPISFSIGSTFTDNILEGAETVNIRVGQSESLQVGDNPGVAITILDNTTASVRLTSKTYTALESDVRLTVCAEIVGAELALSSTLTIPALLNHVTTDFMDIFFNRDFSFGGSNPVSCVDIIVLDNSIREELYENFTIRLGPYSASNAFPNLQVDESPSNGFIIDDDQLEVSFQKDFVSFLENSSDKNIFLQLQGGSLATDLVVIVYNNDTDEEVGQVTFEASTLTSQMKSFNFNYDNNDIALEPTRNLRLGIEEMLEKFSVVSPSEMILEIIDDDVVTIEFASLMYSYGEDHGTVNDIEVRISHEIAQELEVFYFGDPSSQIGVVQSGVSILSSVVFLPNASALSLTLIDEFTIMDDLTALELIEQYSISFLNASSANVMFGSPTMVSIMDDDNVAVSFDTDMYSFFENVNMTSNIFLQLSTSIAQPLNITVDGGPGGAQFVVNFQAGQTSQMLQSYSIQDDDIALESDEFYTLTLINPSPLDNVTFAESASLIITDDDSVTVTFSQPTYRFSEVDNQSSSIIINLSTRIAQNLDISISADPGTQPDTVVSSGFLVGDVLTFTPSSDLSFELPGFPITDDDVALETIESYEITFSDPQPDTNVILGPASTIEIIDDDVVMVMFDSDTYRFSEDMLGLIGLRLTRAVAQNVTVTINGAPGSIPNVIISGPTVNQEAIFLAYDSIEFEFPIEIGDDKIALENLESYMISMTLISPSSNNITVGDPATIEITSDDVVEVTFSTDNNTFFEEDILPSIGIDINNPIAKDLEIFVFGESLMSIGVRVSGVTVNTSVTFFAQMEMTQSLTVMINDDSVALENDEVFDIAFTSSSLSDNVMLGPNTGVTIIDTDVVTVDFNELIYPFFENANQSSGIMVVISNEIAQDLSVNVFADPGIQPDTVQSSGFSANSTVMFSAFSTQAQTLPSYGITDDEIALETVELYMISFVSSNPSNRVMLGSDSTVQIIDDDNVIISLPGDLTFAEGDSTAQVEITIDRVIYTDISVDLFGESLSQYGVVNNGPKIDTTLTFPAQGNLTWFLNLPISNDFVAWELNEVYNITVTGTSQPAVISSDTTTVTILDNDNAMVQFVESQHVFLERSGLTEQILVVLNAEVARDLTITVFGDTFPLADGVVDSGTTVNMTFTFKAFNTNSTNLAQFVQVEILDDDVSGEPDQLYDLNIINVPSNVLLGLDVTTIVIDDDDQSGLKFLPFTGPLVESAGMYNLTVILSGEISSEVSVDVIDENGDVIETVFFSPMTGVGEQEMIVTIFFTDDEIALESNEIIGFSLNNSIGASLVNPSIIDVTIFDDDVVTVNFVQSMYNYNEDDGFVTDIQVQLSNEIADNLTVSITGGPGQQLSTVIISGVQYSANVAFPAGTLAQIPISIQSFMITDDEVGLESVEEYQLLFMGSSLIFGVVLGAPTTIAITDEDVVSLGFDAAEVFYSEGDGEVDLSVNLNRPIADSFNVRVTGVTTPLLSGVFDSGSDVDELLNFMAQGVTTVMVVFNVTDDDVAGEPIQKYNLTLSEEPDNVTVSQRTAEININDNDQAGVRLLPFVGPLFESAGAYNVTVVLDGDISSPVSVTVVDGSGSIVETVTFQPIQGQSSQQAVVTITFDDNEIALEEDKILQFSLSNHVDVFINEPSQIEVVVKDDDRVMVMFTNQTYTFFEDVSGDIGVKLSTTIAQNLTVTILGSSPSDTSFVSNGPTISYTVTFASEHNAQQPILIPIMIGDDMFGLESIESYPINITNPLFIQNVDIGAPATIEIMDDDFVTVQFINDQNRFIESDATGTIEVSIDVPITNDLVVNIFGESLPVAGIMVSGDIVNTTVTFIARGSMLDSFTISINNDSVGLENDEEFEIQFTQSVPSDGVMFGSNSRVIISDDDMVEVRFDNSYYFVNENEQSRIIPIIINRPIAQDFSVDVIGRVIDRPSITVSGTNINTTLQFTAFGSMTNNVTVFLKDDNNALEDIENLELSLVNTTPNNVATQSVTSVVMISDDDVVTVRFVSPNYTFIENEINTFANVQIDRTILKDLSVSIFGGSSPIEGVVISGETVDLTVTFAAQGDLFEQIPIGINDDLVGNENDETYTVAFVSSNPSGGVALGDATTIKLIDDDDIAVQFERTVYSFNESDGTVSVRLLLNGPVSEEITITVFGGPTNSSTVSESAPYINQTVTFIPNGSLSVDLTFTLQDDEYGLEDNEMFQLFLEDPEMSDIDVSSVTDIVIIDDDVVMVTFVDIQDPISEDAGSQPIGIVIDRNILNDLVVMVSGISPVQDGVTVSGQPVNATVTFVAGPITTAFFNVGITNDEDALENTEQLNLMLTGSIPLMNVQLGPNMILNILDEDNVTVSFSSSINSVQENGSSITVTLHIDKQILTPFTVDITGDPAPQPDTVVISGTRVEELGIMFTGSSPYMTVTVVINDDDVSLEDDEEYSLTIGNSSSSMVITGNDTVIRIIDNDEFSFGPTIQNVIYPENIANQIFMIEFSPSVRNNSFQVSSNLAVNQTTAKIMYSLVSINCGQDSNDILMTFSSLVPVKINCSVVIDDDVIAYEDDEVYDLVITLINTATPIQTQSMTLTIVDDDVAEVITDVPQRNVTEGGDSLVCVALTVTSIRDTIVVLSSTEKSATDGDDFIGGGEKTIVIPAGLAGSYCTNYSTLPDNDIEGDEEFDIEISRVSFPEPPMATDPKTPTIGSQSSTTVVIQDTPPESRTCRIDSSSQSITTFGGSEMYSYNRTCEHALLLEQSTLGQFGAFIESLDGTFMTTRVGVRIGSSESIVVNAYNRSVIRQTTLMEISISFTASKLSIVVSALDFLLEISDSIITTSVGANSSLLSHTGLCGDVNGNLVLRNGSLLDSNDTAALNKLISQSMVPPSETFIRMVTRQECGLTGDDLETGDPMYVVPLYTPSEQEPHTYSLCYEIHGYANQTYNFISDECTEVYGHYYETTDPDPYVQRAFHGVDRIDVRAVNNLQQCVSISVVLENNTCSTSVGESSLSGMYSQYGVSVRQAASNRTRISVPNCVDNSIIMYVMCKDLGTAAPYLELKVIRGLDLKESSHGIIGQFWNVETKVTKYTQELRDGTTSDNAYLVELMPRNKPKRSFIGFLYQRTWNFQEFPCIYAGNAQGGAIYEAADGEPNDSLIEGTISDYLQNDFTFDQFNKNRC